MLTDRQTNTQTDITENNTTLAVWVLISVPILILFNPLRQTITYIMKRQK